MRINFLICAAAVAAMICFTGCEPDTPDIITPIPGPGTGNGNGEEEGETPQPKPEEQLDYNHLDAYAPLKTYVNRTVSPDFKLGAAVTVSNYLKKTQEYNMAVENFDEMTAGNAMKQSSVMRADGTMNFSQVRNFLDLASQSGMTVYGHTLAWHSQQQNTYLNNLIADKRVDLPAEEGVDVVLFESDFNDGQNPFIGWGNNSTTVVEDGVFKATNPSAASYWEAQFARDFDPPFTKGQKYVLKFKIRGSAEGAIRPGFQILDDNYTSAGDFPTVKFGTEWSEAEVACECKAAGGTRLVFSFGEFAGDIYIDDFEFKAVGVQYIYESMSPEEKKAVLTDVMDRWIKGMMEVTAKDVSAWDAVNESISGNDTDRDGFYELESGKWGSANNFYWQDYLGSEDYVRIVIAKARQYYAEFGGTKPLRLFINDYNLESDWDDNKKLRSLIHWIEIWESDGVTKIDGIGSQMHISYYENPSTQKSKEEHVVKMLQLMAGTGKLVKISELDMGYVDKDGNTLAASSLSLAQHKAMADFYEFIIRKYFEIVPPAQQYGITQWCPTDSPGALGTGWRGGEPTGLWDQNYNRKYAYAGFANGLRSVK